MLNSTKKYFKIQFDKYKGNDLGQPLLFGVQQNNPTGNEQFLPFGYGINPQMNKGIHGFGGMSMNEIQGVIDRNVSDATRSIRAEYEEMVAKREADSIRRITELEMRMEIYKLELRAKELENKEKKIREELLDFEIKKAEGLGNVREYTKTIAGGLFELGKSAFGLDDVVPKKKSKEKVQEEEQTQYKTPHNTQSNSVSGFTEKQETAKDKVSGLSDIKGMLKNMSDDEKYELMDIIMNSEDTEQTEESISNEAEQTETQENAQTATQTAENISQTPKTEEINENLPITNND
jgi:hypothetical protein